MPSKSKAQHNFMAMCDSPGGRAKAQGKCPPQDVAHEFKEADKGRTHGLPPHMDRARKKKGASK